MRLRTFALTAIAMCLVTQVVADDDIGGGG